MEIIRYINQIISIVFTICYLHQLIYILVPFVIRRRSLRGQSVPMRKYAVLISARNERAVISELIASVRAQSYPAELITVFVVADNCTDDTAEVARHSGAVVWERFDKTQIGKGYALDFLFTRIGENYPSCEFDGYFIFDADNLLDENYIAEMNKTFNQGHKIITGYRNSKNYAGNWISAGYSLWFLRESQFLSRARMLLGTSCAVSGTGFLVAREIIERNDGWKFTLLTEDIEFSVHSILSGECIAYCEKAVLYDEQPVTFRQSWHQRLRWAKGFYQVFGKYGWDLVRGIFKKRGFSCFDALMTIAPAAILTSFGILCNACMLIAGLVQGTDVMPILRSFAEMLTGTYLLFFVVGAVTLVSEWRSIHCRRLLKVVYLFTFPLFMLTYVPIALAALFFRVEWTPITHSDAKTLAEVRSRL